MTKHAFYLPIKEELRKAGYELLRHCNGSHEIWKHEGGKEITITRNLNDRHLANKVLRIAGIKTIRL